MIRNATKIIFFKKGRSEEFQDVNSAVWHFFMTRKALTPALGPMIQEETFKGSLQNSIEIGCCRICGIDQMVREVEN